MLPLGFEIEAKTLEEALRKFPDGVKVALEQAIDEAREMRREAASRIVVPEVGGGVGPGPGGRRRQDQVSLMAPRAMPAIVLHRVRCLSARRVRRGPTVGGGPQPFPGSGPGGKPMRTVTETAVGMPPAANAPVYPVTARVGGLRQLLRHPGR